MNFFEVLQFKDLNSKSLIEELTLKIIDLHP